ncbi:MAG: hypothetical protein AAEJ52_02650 [Myxococcota bacterium]
MLATLTVHPVSRDRPTLQAWVWVVIAAGLLARVVSAFQSFWLDEIWSYLLAQDVDSAWQVLTVLKHDNNHILNTLFIRAMGEHEHWFVYRMLSLATGTAVIYLLARLALGWGSAAALAAAILAAASHPLTLASAQARGYSAAMFFALVALFWIRAEQPARTWKSCFGFWLVVTLGILSHLTFLYAYMPLVGWTLIRRWQSAGKLSAQAWIEMARLHAVPVVIVAAMYIVFYSEIVIGGGPTDYEVSEVVGRTIAAAVGTPTTGNWVLLALAITGVLVPIGLWLAARDGAPLVFFFVSVLFLAPVLIFLVAAPKLLFPRYFWVCIPFLYLLAANVLGWIHRGTRTGKGVYWVLLAAFVLANGAKTLEHVSVGRTNYADALTYLEEHTEGDIIQIGSDHDFRNAMVIRFYARYRTAGKSFAIVPKSSWTGPGPEWYLMHSWISGPFPQRHVTLAGDRPYTLVARFDNGIGTGWKWFLYRNDNR